MIIVKANMLSKIWRIIGILYLSVVTYLVLILPTFEKRSFALIALGIMLLVHIVLFIQALYDYIQIDGQFLIIRRLFHGTIVISRNEIRGYFRGKSRGAPYVEIYYNKDRFRLMKRFTENYDILLDFLAYNSRECRPVDL